jgi:hypothetical protein
MTDDGDDVCACKPASPHKMADIGITLSITRKGRVPGRRGKGEKKWPMGG